MKSELSEHEYVTQKYLTQLHRNIKIEVIAKFGNYVDKIVICVQTPKSVNNLIASNKFEFIL